MAQALISKDDFLGAIKVLDICISLFPKNGDSYFGRGYAQQLLGNLDAAMADYSLAVELDTKFAEPYRSKASVYEVRGNYKEELANYNKYLRLLITQEENEEMREKINSEISEKVNSLKELFNSVSSS